MNSRSRVVLITGASRGIGEAAAQHFAALGDRVVVLARNGDRLERLAAGLRDAGGEALAVPADVGDYPATARAVAAATDAFGTVDVLVNNAGLIEPIAHLAETDPDDWSRAVDVNLKGVYHGFRCVLPVMLAQGGGTIINISSGAATNALEGWSAYCATKAAVLALTRCAHKEYAARGIRVLGLSPGTVATDMQTTIRDSGINPVSQLDPAVHIPADWVARAIAFLCGPGGDAFLGEDFSLKNDEGRALVGLPPVGAARR